MRRPKSPWRDERGIALVLALLVLLTLTGLVLAFLSVSAFEPQISKNLSDTARARYLAEAGIERGFNVLVGTADGNNTWSALLTGGAQVVTASTPSCTGTGATGACPWVAVAGLTGASLSGVTNGGTFSVIVRNDNGANDSSLTGLSGSTNPSMDTSVTVDGNKVIIMRATGTFGNASKTIEVVVRRTSLPPFPGAVNVPGRQSDTTVGSSLIDIDGRDYGCSSSCDTTSNWTQTGDASALRYGIATQPGIQTNNGNPYETNVENAFNTAAKRAGVKGKDEASMGTSTTGLNAINADATLTPTEMDKFVSLVASNPATAVLQSTISCPMQLTGTSTPTSQPTLTNGCGLSQTLNLGSRSDPKLVFFRGEVDTTSAFTGLRLNSGIKGAGILVIEDGDMKNYGNLEWDGLVIVTGQYTSLAFMGSSNTTIRGAAVAYESNAGEAAGYFDLYIDSAITNLSIRSSRQNLNMVQLMRSLHVITNWREI